MTKPKKKPLNPKFSTGPSAKHQDYKLSNLPTELLSRSNRSVEVTNLVFHIQKKIYDILEIPKDYKVILTAGSGTAAMEIALWNLLGSNTIDILAWDNFGYMWQNDIENELKLKNVNVFRTEYGAFPNLDKVDFANNDVVFAYLGTASGVFFNQESLIPKERKGLMITDATSHVFTNHVPWDKIDVFTFSWQKALGGEAQHGTIVLSPKAVERLKQYTPQWPMPRLFNIRPQAVLEGEAINTLSTLCLLDFVDALDHFEKKGGLPYGIKKINENFQVLQQWVEKSNWVKFLAEDISFTSKVAVCLKVTNQKFISKSLDQQKEFINKIHKYLADNHIAYDIKSYRTGPLGFRIWAGPTIDKEDLILLTEWLDYCFANL